MKPIKKIELRSLRLQLLGSHLSLVVLVGIVLSGAVLSFFSLSRSIDGVLAQNFPTVLEAQSFEASVARQRLAFELYVGGDVPQAQPLLVESLQSGDRALRRLENLVTDEEEVSRFRTLRGLWDRQALDAASLANANSLSPQQGLAAVIRQRVAPRMDEMVSLAKEISALNEISIISENERTRQESLRFSYIGIAVTIGALVVALLLAFRMIDLSLKPLAIIAKAAEAIGTGDLDQKLEFPRRDEIGALADSVNEMAARLAELRSAAKRRLERAQRMSDLALNSLYDPVIVTDAQFRIVHLNRAAVHVFGEPETPKMLVNEHIPDTRIWKAIDHAIGTKAAMATEDEQSQMTLRDGGVTRIFRLRATPMNDEEGKCLGAVVVMEDITYLRDLDRMKTEFIGVAAHELRTPVASLLLSAQLLDEGAAGDLTASQKELVSVQRQDLERLEKLTHDLLDVTKLEAGTLAPRLELIPIGELFRTFERTIRPSAVEHSINLELNVAEDVPALFIDRVQIGRVLINLANNAIRHTPPGGRVTVTARRDENQVSFAVEDTGEGIPAEYRERIFERFVQVPGATQGGAGLGLSIAKKIIHNHGGKMSVVSEVGKGSVFEFTLPLPGQLRTPTPGEIA